MIAVFTRYQEQFRELQTSPEGMFIRISSVNKTRGTKFTGVVFMHEWYKDREVMEAFESLKHRQPELF